MDTSYINEVAKIIYNQLNANVMELLAWGSEDFRACYIQNKPGLQFGISTPKIPRGGRIQILLDEGSDTYVVRSFREHGVEMKDLQEKNDVYFDGLHDVINSLIEDEKSMKIAFFDK